MYSDKGKDRGTLLVAVIFALILSAAAAFFVVKDPGRDLSEEGATAIREAVQKSARQCYVVEGVYPSDLDYLKENYGLNVNTDDYYVTYDAFASNLPPSVIVTTKQQQ